MHNTAGGKKKDRIDDNEDKLLIYTISDHVDSFHVWIPLQQGLSASLPPSFDPHSQSQNHHFPFQLSLVPLLPLLLLHHFPQQVGCPHFPMMMQPKQTRKMWKISIWCHETTYFGCRNEVLLQVWYRRHEGCFGFPTSLHWTLSFCWASHIGLGSFHTQKGP